MAILGVALKRTSISILIVLLIAIVLTKAGVVTSSAYLAKWLIVYFAIIPVDVITISLTGVSAIADKDQGNGYRASHLPGRVRPPDLARHLAIGVQGLHPRLIC